MDTLLTLAKALPRLKSQFQLTGLVVLVGAYVAIRIVAPEQVHAQISAGAVGVVFLVFGQVFSSLGSIPEADRAKLIIKLFIAFLTFVVLLVGATGYFLLDPKPSADSITQTDAASRSKKALLVSNLSEAYVSVGRILAFFDEWGHPPAFSTMRVEQGEVHFTSIDGRVVATSVDPKLLPVPSNFGDAVVDASRLTPSEAAGAGRFYSEYGRFLESLKRLTSVKADATRGAFIDATSIARETLSRGRAALCGLGATPPRIFPNGSFKEPIPLGCQ